MFNRKIKRNIIKCKLCNDVIESKFTHDFVMCKCGACFVDGGKEYVRYGYADLNDIIVLTEYEDEKNDET